LYFVLQWKVRRTLAFSIHELAVIVGEEVTNQDLVPVFNEFLKDLDEVRIGILKHLADFLRVSLIIGYDLMDYVHYFLPSFSPVFGEGCLLNKCCLYSKTSLTQTLRGQGNDFELSRISSYVVKLCTKILQRILVMR